jgi:monoamine oxidase
VDELARRLESRIQTGRRLRRVQQVAGKYELAFDKGTDVDADIVVLTLPFTVLREVELDLDMSTEKRKAINELGYGTNAKVLAGTSSRPWRKQGFAGSAFSDEAFQLGWDNARGQAGQGAGITLYSGGKAGLQAGEGTPRSQVERLLPGYDKVFAGAEAAFNGNVFRMDWPRHAFTKASYACYKPGQWTTIAGREAEPIGNVLFAGEHCSEDFQGFMNGAAETGRVAADEIIARIKD